MDYISSLFAEVFTIFFWQVSCILASENSLIDKQIFAVNTRSWETSKDGYAHFPYTHFVMYTSKNTHQVGASHSGCYILLAQLRVETGIKRCFNK